MVHANVYYSHMCLRVYTLECVCTDMCCSLQCTYIVGLASSTNGSVLEFGSNNDFGTFQLRML